MVWREALKLHVLYNNNEKKRPTGAAGLVRCGFFGTGGGSQGRAKDSARRVFRPTFPLPFPIWQKFAAHRDLDPISLGVFDFLHFHGEIDRAHDPVPKFLVNQLLQGISVYQANLVEPV